MRNLLALFLLVSLTANVWLWLRPAEASPLPATRPRTSGIAVGNQRLPPGNELARLVQGGNADLAGLRDGLRAAGVDESSIRGIVEGFLQQEYRDRIAAWRAEQLRAGWWQGAGVQRSSGEPLRLYRSLVREPLQALLGRDPLDLEDAERHFDFLAPDRRRLLAEIGLDYSDLETQLREMAAGSFFAATTRGDLEAAQKVKEERRRDLLAALTPEELAEYDLRFSGSAVTEVSRSAGMEASETEYRLIKPLIDAYEKRLTEVPRGPDAVAAYASAMQENIDRLVDVLGYGRAADYLWSIDTVGVHAEAATVFLAAGLPRHRATQLLQLAAETGRRATVVHLSATLSPEEKRQALLSLQEWAGPQFEALAPTALRTQLPEQLRAWLPLLGEGKYQRFLLSLQGNGWMVPGANSVTGPVVGNPSAHAFLPMPAP